MEKDVSDADRYDRILRYVHICSGGRCDDIGLLLVKGGCQV